MTEDQIAVLVGLLIGFGILITVAIVTEIRGRRQ